MVKMERKMYSEVLIFIQKPNNVTFIAKKATIKTSTSQALYWQNMSLFQEIVDEGLDIDGSYSKGQWR